MQIPLFLLWYDLVSSIDCHRLRLVIYFTNKFLLFQKFTSPMKIKYLSKEYTFDLNELENQSIGSLKDKIREVVKECASLPDDKILLFHNKAKITSDRDAKLSNEGINITNDSTVFIVIIASNPPKSEEKKEKTSSSVPGSQTPQGAIPNPYQMPHSPAAHNMFGYPQMGSPNMMGSPNGYGMPDMGGFEKQIIDQMLNNPDSIIQMIETQMPNLSEEQKGMLKQNIEVMRQNPELLKQMMNNPMVMNAMRNPAMGGMPNPYMMGNPNMMGTPNMMGSPAMAGYNPYMMNQGFYNPYMAQMQSSPAPANGPCSHGFYSLPYICNIVTEDNLERLKEMGFYDLKDNIEALIINGGDISNTVGYLSDGNKHKHSK